MYAFMWEWEFVVYVFALETHLTMDSLSIDLHIVMSEKSLNWRKSSGSGVFLKCLKV